MLLSLASGEILSRKSFLPQKQRLELDSGMKNVSLRAAEFILKAFSFLTQMKYPYSVKVSFNPPFVLSSEGPSRID